MVFAENGDLITGDSNGSIFVWGRGEYIYYYYVANVCFLITNRMTFVINRKVLETGNR